MLPYSPFKHAVLRCLVHRIMLVSETLHVVMFHKRPWRYADCCCCRYIVAGPNYFRRMVWRRVLLPTSDSHQDNFALCRLLAGPRLLLRRSGAVFTARNARIASAVLATAIPSVCPSVRLSVRLSVTRRNCVKTTARSTVQFAPLDYYYYYYYTGEDYSDTVTSNAAGALYKIKLNT